MRLLHAFMWTDNVKTSFSGDLCDLSPPRYSCHFLLCVSILTGADFLKSQPCYSHICLLHKTKHLGSRDLVLLVFVHPVPL